MRTQLRTLCLSLAVGLLGGCDNDEARYDARVTGKPNPLEMTQFVEDSVVQGPLRAVDVLWVIDDSCSMYEEQQKLADNADYVIDQLGADFHMGVVSTDMDDQDMAGVLQRGYGHRWVDETTRNPVRVFQAMAVMGTLGSATEKGRAAAYTAIEVHIDGPNAGFYREHASLVIVVVSDEEDQSGAVPIDLSRFIEWLRILKPSSEMVSFISIITPPGNCEPGGYTPGTQYMAVTDAIGGIKWSICEEDWRPALDELGRVAGGLRSEFFLSEIPQPGTIEVTVVEDSTSSVFHEGLPSEEGTFRYRPDHNSITFNDYIPAPFAEVITKYQVQVPDQ